MSDEQAPINTDDAAQVKRRKSKADLERERELLELQVMLATYGGRAFCWRVLEQCGIYHENICMDALPMAKQEGKRTIGIWMLTELLTADPNVYTQMRNEAVLRNTNFDKQTLGKGKTNG